MTQNLLFALLRATLEVSYSDEQRSRREEIESRHGSVLHSNEHAHRVPHRIASRHPIIVAPGIAVASSSYSVGVPRILITGMSGTGKSTVLNELANRGWRTVDTDYDGWTDGAGGLWDEARMLDLLTHAPNVVVSGTSENQGRFYDQFEHVVLLSAPIEVLIDRVRRRTNNPYGRSEEQQQQIRSHLIEIEPLLRRGATIELDARHSVAHLANVIESLTRMPRCENGS